MFGPLYHLTERDDRIRALRESRRVLKSGGYAFAATITRVASFIDALCHDLLGDPDFLSIVDADIETGQHRNLTNEILYFTDAFFPPTSRDSNGNGRRRVRGRGPTAD